jgi:hypothetical protein
MSKTIFLLLCLFPALVWPQPAATASETITRVIRVHTNALKLAAVASGGSRAEVRADDTLNAIVVRGKPSDVETLEKTIRELDSVSSAPGSRNVELTVYLLSGSNSPAPPGADDKLPVITSVVKQLRAVFPYGNYQLLSTMLLRSGEGTVASTDGVLKAFGNPGDGGFPSRYSINYKAARFSPDQAAPSIHLSGFHFVLRGMLPTGSGHQQQFDAGVETDVDLRQGQKVVVGKSNLESVDSALFVVLMAKLVE